MSEATPRGRLFRKYLLVLLVLVGGVLLVSSLVELYFSYQETKTALVRFEREKAVAAAARIEEFVNDIERQLRWTTPTAFDDPRAARDQREIDFLRLLRNVPAVTELAHLDASGREQLRVSRLALDEIGAGRDLSRDPKFLEARSGKTYFGPVYFRNESEPYMSVAVSGGEYGVEVTTAEVNLKAIWDVISRIRVGRAGYAYAVDALGHLIAHPDISVVLQKRDLSALPQVAATRAAGAPAAGDEGAGVIAVGLLGGGRVLTAHAAIAPLGWSVFVEQPLGEAFAPLRAAIIRSAALFALGLALSILASVTLARRMVAPIRTLQAGATRIGAGELGHRIDVRTGDELEALADEFNRSTARLQESYEGLERKVAERTGALARMVDNLKALSETSQALNSTLEVRAVLATIVASAAELAGAHGGAIYEYDDAGREFHVSATHRMDPEHFEALRATPIRLGQGAVGHAGATGTPVQVANILDEREFVAPQTRHILARQGYRSLVAIPLVREQRLLGGLVVWRQEAGSFPAEVVDTLQTFAAQSALAIQNARLFQEIQEKSRQVEEASRAKSQFLANMSHELRTPLNAVIGYTELITEGTYGEVPAKIGEILERIDKGGRHLLGLINDILDLSKIEAGQVTLSANDYSMRDVVHAVVQSVESLAADKRLALEVSVPADLPAARGDARRLTQVLLNLVGNAIKFTDAGRVGISVATDDGAFVVSVTDTGPGIAPEDQPRIFEEFQQIDTSDTRTKGGTGLGLAIAKRIVEMHGGRLWVESVPGQGSTFRFRVPVRTEAG